MPEHIRSDPACECESVGAQNDFERPPAFYQMGQAFCASATGM